MLWFDPSFRTYRCAVCWEDACSCVPVELTHPSCISHSIAHNHCQIQSTSHLRQLVGLVGEHSLRVAKLLDQAVDFGVPLLELVPDGALCGVQFRLQGCDICRAGRLKPLQLLLQQLLLLLGFPACGRPPSGLSP